MGLAIWDALVLGLSYNVTFTVRLGWWPVMSHGLAAMLCTWLGLSYLIGRYSPDQSGEMSVLSTIWKTAIIGCAVISLFIVHSWIYQVVDAQTRFRGFLVPLLIVTCGLSAAGQYLRLYAKKKKRGWLLVISQEEHRVLSSELEEENEELRNTLTLSIAETATRVECRRKGRDRSIAIGNIEAAGKGVVYDLLKEREQGKSIIPLMNWCEEQLQRIPPELVHPQWLLRAEGFGLRPGSKSWRIKRATDILGAAVLLIGTLPIVVAASILVWVEDRGPIFYSQIRTGLYGKPIRIWKLRSMKVNAETEGISWAVKKDPRVTRIGQVIRKMRIDELPQLVSVLRGDLSLIGPRPERPEIEERLEREIPNYRIRHWVRPGLSGWAQVCYPYGASVADSRAKLSYDLFYLRNASFLLDLLVTIKTIRLVANAEGATPKAQRKERLK